MPMARHAVTPKVQRSWVTVQVTSQLKAPQVPPAHGPSTLQSEVESSSVSSCGVFMYHGPMGHQHFKVRRYSSYSCHESAVSSCGVFMYQVESYTKWSRALASRADSGCGARRHLSRLDGLSAAFKCTQGAKWTRALDVFPTSESRESDKNLKERWGFGKSETETETETEKGRLGARRGRRGRREREKKEEERPGARGAHSPSRYIQYLEEVVVEFNVCGNKTQGARIGEDEIVWGSSFDSGLGHESFVISFFAVHVSFSSSSTVLLDGNWELKGDPGRSQSEYVYILKRWYLVEFNVCGNKTQGARCIRNE
ncbi:hypothetical protein C8R45DRAFT_1073367 [Mycena sanguinolenta]|nr:hypothetical protein C8R45DRAFT_1073367 [Mycena sanguinolenta]